MRVEDSGERVRMSLGNLIDQLASEFVLGVRFPRAVLAVASDMQNGSSAAHLYSWTALG